MSVTSVTGLILRETSVEWCQLRQGKAGPDQIAARSAVLDLDEAGRADPAALAAAIRARCPELEGPVAVGLPSDQLLLRVMRLPTTNAAEMAGIVALQVDKISPFPEDRIAASFEVLIVDESGSTVLIAGLRRESVEFLGAVCDKAGLAVLRLDVNPLAWWHLLKTWGQTLVQGRQVVLLPEGDAGLLIVAQDGVPIAFRPTISIAGISSEEYAAELSGEIASLLLSLDVEYEVRPVSRLDVWSDGGPDRALLDQLGRELKCEPCVRSLADLPGLCRGVAERALTAFPDPAAARGLVRPAVMDLVPTAWRERSAAGRIRRWLLTATCVALGLWALVMGSFLGVFAWRRAGAAAVEAQLAKIEREASEVKELRQRVESLELYLDRQRSALECLREVSDLVPDEIAIVSFQYKKGKSVMIRGECLSPDPIYTFKEALDSSSLFKDISMGSIQPSTRKASTVYVFQMAANLPGSDL